MDIRGITFSIEALPIRKGLPLFYFPQHFRLHIIQPQVTYHHFTFLRQYLIKLLSKQVVCRVVSNQFL